MASSRIDRKAKGGTSASKALTTDRHEEEDDDRSVWPSELPRPTDRAALQACALTASLSLPSIMCGPIRMCSRIRVRRASGLAAPYAAPLMRRAPSMLCGLVLAGGLRCTAPGVAATDAQHSDATFDPHVDPFGWTADRRLRTCRDRLVHGAHRLRRPVEGDVRAPHRPPSGDAARANGSAACWSTPAAPAPVAPIRLVRRADYGQALLDRFDIVAWDPRGTGRARRRSTASTTTTLLRRAATSPRMTMPSANSSRSGRGVRHECVDKNGRTIQYVGTNNSARDMDAIRASARRGRDQLLRVQLRQRARGDVGDAVPRHRAGRGARRRHRPHAAGLEERGPAADRRVSRPRSTRSSPSAVPTPMRVLQRRRRRGRVRPLMDEHRRAPVPSEDGRPASRWSW